MSDFKAKIHKIQFWLGLHPRPCRESLQRSLGHPAVVGAVNTSQRAVMLCGWGLKAGMVRV